MKLFLFVLVLVSWPGLSWASKVALVIGNSNYSTVAPLDNPGNDAAAVSASLTAQGFRVLARTDLNRAEMRDTLREFRQWADGAEIALVYYAGHGIEISGQNFLMPVDARLEDERDAGLELVEIELILRQISGAKQLKMVVLDACRNNPFVTKMQREDTGRNVGNGLGRIENAGADTLIAYAAAAGEITPDGQEGGNSPFTRAFLNAMAGPPTDVRRLLGRVRDEMRRSVPGAAPFVYTSLGGGELVINPRSAGAVPPKPAPKETARRSISEDFVRIDRNGTLEDWNAFLITHEAQSDHPLYAFALEKRESLKAVQTPADRVAVLSPGPDKPLEDQTVIAPSLTQRGRDDMARALQEQLRARGCYRGAIDGILGRGSARGLRSFGAVIGTPVVASQQSDVAELDAAIALFESHPSAQCPKPQVVRTQPAKPTQRSSPTRRQTATVPKAAPAPKPAEPEEPSHSRKNPTKFYPGEATDCIGNRRHLFDCD